MLKYLYLTPKTGHVICFLLRHFLVAQFAEEHVQIHKVLTENNQIKGKYLDIDENMGVMIIYEYILNMGVMDGL